ncbi:rubrerythrin [Caldicoprobacter guelmensis]|uniref:spore coat protein n=1 Tax=Caldicoprobacter guelmensis TaxID=1170224 RepID=UPI00195CEBA4|nr:spore coat protein [Caldicoprobacter guelmensis]MBM7583278.1 rubrerythrin [Caldicoprobacter guelmensis]
MSQNQLTERDMLYDSIMTEKYVSDAYNTTVMESVNQNIIEALQHIQQEEQEHAKLFFEAMHHRGWYTVEAAHPSQAAKQEVDQQISSQMQSRRQQLEQKIQNQG